MSYVAEWRGGGPQDLLRGFDSFRNCQLNDFLWQQWLDLKRVVFLHRPFYYRKLPHFLKRVDQAVRGRIVGFDLIVVLQLRQDLPGELFTELHSPLIEGKNIPDDPLDEDLVFV